MSIEQTVTDADRRAALRLIEMLPDRSEDCDTDEIAEHFTRHRADATALLVEALRMAHRHIQHQAAWIGKQNAGYSFEALGEDMPTIEAALAPYKATTHD